MIQAQELLLAVDGHNRSITPVDRKTAHATGVWHRVAHIIVHNGHGMVLCEQRSLRKDLSPGAWECVFGGHLAPGQDTREGASQELFEETGIGVAPGDLEEVMVHRYSSKDGRVKEFQYVYLACWDGPESELVPEPDEVEQIAWRPVDEVVRLITQSADWVHLGYEQEILAIVQQRAR